MKSDSTADLYITNPSDSFRIHINDKKNSIHFPSQEPGQSFLNVTSNLKQTGNPILITPTTTTVNINWPIVQNKIDDLNE